MNGPSGKQAWAAVGAGLAARLGSPVTCPGSAGTAFWADGGAKAGAGQGLEVSHESHSEECALAPEACESRGRGCGVGARKDRMHADTQVAVWAAPWPSVHALDSRRLSAWK